MTDLAQCAWCSEQYEPGNVFGKRFCSKRCKSAAAYASRLVVRDSDAAVGMVACAWCGQEFQPKYHTQTVRRYCSAKCAKAGYKIPVAERDRNGKLAVDVEERQPHTTLYTETCSMCGEAEDKVLTDAEARALRPTRCVRCGGRVLVDTALLGIRSSAA